jgi:C4-dicarboxylate-binding protein DctP
MPSLWDRGHSGIGSIRSAGARRLLASAALFALGFTTRATGTEPVELRIAVQMPPGSIETNNLYFFKERVEAASNGGLRIAIFPSGQLVEDSQVVKAVTGGQIDIGASRIGHFEKTVPAIGIFLLPFMFNVPAIQQAAMKPGSALRAPLDAALLRGMGAHVLWWQPLGSYAFLSKGEPIVSPNAIAGKTVRVFDDSSTAFIRACGGKPVYVSGNDMYEAYKTGRVEIGQVPPSPFASRRLWEVMNRFTNTRHVTDALLIVINEQRWTSLSADYRRILEEAAGEAQKLVWGELENVDKDVVAISEEHGTTVTNLSEEQVQEWKLCSEPLLEGYLEKSGPLGAEVMAGYRQIIRETYSTPASSQTRP